MGDRVSLEIIASQPDDLQGKEVAVSLMQQAGEVQLQTQFGQYGIGGRMQATFTWSWVTSGLPPGDYTVGISIPAHDLAWTETLSLLPAAQAPPPEPNAAWAHAESDCCLAYYITGTAASRDLDELLEMADLQAEDVARKLGVEIDQPLEVTFLPRVLGHGGFAGEEISISYLDRNYANSHSDLVLHHEIVHKLDALAGGELRPTLLSEGLAVYLTGGHFKPEPLLPRAAVLLPPQPGCVSAQDILASRGPAADAGACGLGWYMPLIPLLDDFYLSQHEVGYLQAASLIQYMVETWDWPAFEAFYRDIHQQPEEPAGIPQELGLFSNTALEPENTLGPQAAAVNAALVAHFGITLQQLETQFLAALQAEILQPELAEDVRLSAGFFDTVRRYQQLLDPSAYFLTAWLPDGKAMREQGIVADFLRHPATPENLALELMLVAADAALQATDYNSVETTLESVNRVLDSLESASEQADWSDPLAAQYYALVTFMLSQGYQPQQVALENKTAQVWVSTTGPELVLLQLENLPAGWVIKEDRQTPAPP